MPTYDYICRECNKKFEVFVSIAQKDALEPSCPECGSKDTRQSFQSMFYAKSGKGGGCSSSCASGNCAACGH